MALKAGYNGIKKKVLDSLLQMSDALIIKSLGTALSLSDAGELRVRHASESQSGVVQPDGETTFIEGGLLKSAASGFSITLLATYPEGMAENQNISVQGMSEYDAVIISTWQVSDGGYSSVNRCYRLIYKAFEAITQSCDYYYQRGVRVTADFTNNTIQYYSAAPNENVGYKPIIYEVYGVKF